MRWKALPAVFDVNVLVYAFRDDSPHHEASQRCIQQVRMTDSVILPDIIALGFVRIVTNARIFPSVTTPANALSFINDIRRHRSRPSENEADRTWEVFERIAGEGGRGGNAIPDVYLAATALNHEATLYTFDRDFERFDGLRIQVPQ